VEAVTDISKCPACGQIHDVTEPCPADAQLRVFDDVELCEQPDPLWDIEGVTQQGSLEIGFGPSDAGKSTLYGGRACSLATGVPWLGMPIVQRGPVVALVFEGKHAFKKKIRAWKAMNGYEDQRIGVYVIEDRVNFLDSLDVFRLVHVINQTKATEIMVDTLAQSICADEENAQLQIAVNNAAMLRRLTGARVVFIHHSGKNRKRGARGGSALTAAADTVLSLDEERDGHVLRCVRQRDGERFPPVFLRLSKVPDGSTVLFERREAPTAPLLSEKAKLHAAILTFLRSNLGADTDAVRKHVGRRKTDVLLALAELKQAGRIELNQQNGRKAKGWIAA
jgi:hypothetical protein